MHTHPNCQIHTGGLQDCMCLALGEDMYVLNGWMDGWMNQCTSGICRDSWLMLFMQVSALFHIASSKGPPPIPENISPECRDFLLLCFNRCPPDCSYAAQYTVIVILHRANCANQLRTKSMALALGE